MALIYEKPSLALLEKSFDKKHLPKEMYKMQKKDPRVNKLKAAIHIDSGPLGVEFTVNKTIPDFNNRGCTGEFSCAKVKKVLVPRTQQK